MFWGRLGEAWVSLGLSQPAERMLLEHFSALSGSSQPASLMTGLFYPRSAFGVRSQARVARPGSGYVHSQGMLGNASGRLGEAWGRLGEGLGNAWGMLRGGLGRLVLSTLGQYLYTHIHIHRYLHMYIHTWGSLAWGGLGNAWACFGEAWGMFGNASGRLGEAWGGLGTAWGMLCECFREAWECSPQADLRGSPRGLPLHRVPHRNPFQTQGLPTSRITTRESPHKQNYDQGGSPPAEL